MKRKATSKDVAALAGVSRSAVSLVLNGHGEGNLSAGKQAAIRAAAKELDYTPNSVALSLRMQRSRTIGVVTDAIATSAFGGRLLQGASEVATEQDYLLVVIDTELDGTREDRAIRTLQSHLVDGFMYAAMGLKAYDPAPGFAGSHTVLANCYSPTTTVVSVIADEVQGSREATEHLLALGHRDVVMLVGDDDAAAVELRRSGFRAAMRDAGLGDGAAVTAGWRIDTGFAAASHLLSTRTPRPTAVVCANDYVATGVVLAAMRLGLEVPRDLSVVGYDDDENIASRLVPPLTTVRLPHREIGRVAMEHLIARLDGAPDGASPSGPTRLPCPLVVRESTAPPGP